MKKLIIEVRANEYTVRDPNPNVPWTIEEITADAQAVGSEGASIYHFHARKADGSASHDYGDYREIMLRVRASSGIMLHPTLGANHMQRDASIRLENIRRLCAGGQRPEVVPVDVASGNIDRIDVATNRHVTDDQLYINTTGTIRDLAAGLTEMGIKPKAVIYHIPSFRHAIAMTRAGVFPQPLLAEFVLTEGACLSGHPVTVAGLSAYLAAMPPDIAVEWTAMSHGGSLLPLVELIIRAGGHVAIGLGDYHYSEEGLPDNAWLVRRVAEISRACGRRIATPDEARAMISSAAVERDEADFEAIA